MLKDQCDVKKLASCEIMGGADNICSDKTGTLTNNVMEVVKLYSGADFTIESTVEVQKEADGIALMVDPNTKKPIKVPRQQDFAKMGLNAKLIEKLTEGICCNVPLQGPSPTDEAMTYMIRGCNFDAKDNIIQDKAKIHETKSDGLYSFDFTSGRKRMTSFTKGHGLDGYGVRAQLKGASEIVLEQCN